MVSPAEWAALELIVNRENFERFYISLAQQQITNFYKNALQTKIDKADPFYRASLPPPPPPPCSITVKGDPRARPYQPLAVAAPYEPLAVAAPDPDGLLVPLPTLNANPPARIFTAPTNDYISALYRPYTPPV